jgi:hypothetical protein
MRKGYGFTSKITHGRNPSHSPSQNHISLTITAHHSLGCVVKKKGEMEEERKENERKRRDERSSKRNGEKAALCIRGREKV